MQTLSWLAKIVHKLFRTFIQKLPKIRLRASENKDKSALLCPTFRTTTFRRIVILLNI